eukprot:TRINITY_DN22396_c0_g1_i1.p2 TRINITY_DN22396_c0_g1~~TRINITY_DN22396_c0_g1_i1.p2  ORF type:complete len:609 (+),score=181.80 TRINITY_DN22396_c0_g1_i1:110-1936(+)
MQGVEQGPEEPGVPAPPPEVARPGESVERAPADAAGPTLSSSSSTAASEGESSSSVAGGGDAQPAALPADDAGGDALPADEGAPAQPPLSHQHPSALPVLPVLLPVSPLDGDDGSTDSWFDPESTTPQHHLLTDWTKGGYPLSPSHGADGCDLDLTGTWSFRVLHSDPHATPGSASSLPPGRASHRRADEDRYDFVANNIEVDHSSFGHLSATSCHGWFWGTTGYIRLILPTHPAQHSALGSSQHGPAPAPDLQLSEDVASYPDTQPFSEASAVHDEEPANRNVQLITTKYIGHGMDKHGNTVIHLDGERRNELGEGRQQKFEILIRPKSYVDVGFGDDVSRDLTIEVAGSRFRVHSAVLATFMPHLRMVLDAGMRESEEKVIPCHGDSPHAWRVLLERIYDITGCFHASAALNVIPLLDKYQVPKLWSEAIAELKRLPQSPRPHPHVFDLLCRCEAKDVVDHWFTVAPPDPDELTLFIRECREPEATRIVSQRAADRWRKETTERWTQINDVMAQNKTLQRHIDAIRHVVSTHAAPAAAWRLQTMVVPDFYINNNLPPASTSAPPASTHPPHVQAHQSPPHSVPLDPPTAPGGGTTQFHPSPTAAAW